MSTESTTWPYGHQPGDSFGVTDADFAGIPRNGQATKIVNVRLGQKSKDQGKRWLRCAMLALGILAAAAAVVSFQAQFVFILAYKHVVAIAALQAGIPDVGALVFASLGIALALQGRRAIRARALNVVCVGISIAMNALAATAGWHALAVWVMAPVLYALASDTLIGVVRAYSIARQKALSETLADDEVTPLAVVGGLLLWVLRLVLAPKSTLAGFRGWVVSSVKVAPGTYAGGSKAIASISRKAVTAGSRRGTGGTGSRIGTKTAEFLALVEQQHGPLATFPLDRVSRVSSELAPQVGLHAGSARSALRFAAVAAQNGSQP